MRVRRIGKVVHARLRVAGLGTTSPYSSQSESFLKHRPTPMVRPNAGW